MQRIDRVTLRLILLLIVLAILYYLICFVFKLCDSKTTYAKIQDSHITNLDEKSILPKELIVTFPVGTSKSAKDKALSEFLKEYRAIDPAFDTTGRKYCPCDTIELWQFSKEIQIIGGQDETAGVKPPPGGAGTDTLKIQNANSLTNNYSLIDIFKAEGTKSYQMKDTVTFTPNRNTYNPYKVAILDTGLDSSAINKPVGVPASNIVETNLSCGFETMTDGHGHGTAVTKFLISSLKQPVKILPIRVLDANKNGTLFELLCGINYAVNANANSVIMSLGYYGTDIAILRRYMKKLEEKNILVFAAAGNKIDIADNVEPNTRGADIRNLDNRLYKFYPACYSHTMSNVFSVTTFDEGESVKRVSETQNYSTNYVNVAIIGEREQQTAPASTNGFNLGGLYLRGSSFANPIFAGQAINYHVLNRNWTRDEILDKIRLNAGLTFSPPVPQQVKNNLILNR